MELKTFTGESLAEALKKAKIACGDEAMIVSNREVRKKSLGQPAIYEVVVAIENDKKPQKQQSLDDDVLLNLSEAAKEISKIAEVANIPSTTYKPQPRVEPKRVETAKKHSDKEDLEVLQKEIAKLTDRVKLIQNMVWDKSSDSRSGLVIPPEFAEIYRIAKQSGMSPDHLDTLMRHTVEHMPSAMRQNSETVRRYFNTILRKMIPIRVENLVRKPNKKVVMLVGPTGVGKTTTLAKLAARFAYKLKADYKVGIITLDTYRIGAVDQLTYYAQMMRLGIQTVRDPLDFSSALNSLRHCDYILIDTAGSSQNDREKIARIGQFLDAETDTTIEISLVISANVKLEDMRDIYKNYSSLNIDTIIATKLDETSGIGNLFSFVYENRKPLAYISSGQEVPDDLIVADSDYFISSLLDGFQK